MTKFSCTHCNKTFQSALGLAGHKRMHGTSNGTITKTYCSCILTRKIIQVQYLEKYQNSLKHCTKCNKLFKPGEKIQTFCSKSCATTSNNLARDQSVYDKVSTALTNRVQIKSNHIKKFEIIGVYSKLFLCSCKHCGIKYISRIKKQYCDNHKSLYSDSAKCGYKFTFNVHHYPELFDISQINQYGWFSPGGKAGKWNPCGISRDHKISVTDAIKHNYDPYYITHPLNCELMPHAQNNKKKTKSSITYIELIKLVEEYDNKLNK